MQAKTLIISSIILLSSLSSAVMANTSTSFCFCNYTNDTVTADLQIYWKPSGNETPLQTLTIPPQHCSKAVPTSANNTRFQLSLKLTSPTQLTDKSGYSGEWTFEYSADNGNATITRIKGATPDCADQNTTEESTTEPNDLE